MPEPIVTATDIEEFRAMADAELSDVCTISIPGAGERDFNNENGQYEYPARVIIYGPGAADASLAHGRCRFQVKADINSNVVETTAGDREWTYTTSQLQLPVVDLLIPVDAVVTSISAPHNSTLPGRTFNVQGEVGHKSKPVVRRLRLRELTA